MRGLLIWVVVTVIGVFGVQGGRNEVSEQAIKAGLLAASKLGGIDQTFVQAILANWPKIFTITEARSLLKKIPNVPKEYSELFELYVARLVENRNSPKWKEIFAGTLQTMNLPSENIETFKKIAPEALPAEYDVRRKVMLDSGFSTDFIEKVGPYLDTIVNMDF